MALHEFIAASLLFAQIGCVADMLFRGRTLPMPVTGGALSVISRNESVVGFYALLTVWVVLFVSIDVIVLSTKWPAERTAAICQHEGRCERPTMGENGTAAFGRIADIR